MLSIGLYLLAFALASLFLLIYFTIIILGLYSFYLIFYSSKTIPYSSETNGSYAVDQAWILFTTALMQSLAVVGSSLSQLWSIITQQLQSFLYFIIIMLILIVPSLLWIEYHDVLLSGFHSLWQCFFVQLFFAFINLFTNIIVFFYNLIWPIWSGVSETVRFFTRELPITLLTCSTFSIVDAITRLGFILEAFSRDTSSFFTSTPNPLSDGVVNYTSTMTELGAFIYYILMGTFQCLCSSGTVIWDFLFSWLYTSNPNNSLIPPSSKKKRDVHEAQIVIPPGPITTPSKLGILLSDVISLGLEVPQLIIRSITKNNGPILPYPNGSIYISNYNISLAKLSGDVIIEDLMQKMSVQNLSNGIFVGSFFYNGTNYTYNVSVFPQDPPLGYFPNLKPLAEKGKKVLLGVTSILDYQFYGLYFVFLYFLGNQQTPSASDLNLFPPDNGSTSIIARIASLIIDAVEFLFNLLMGFASGNMLACDKRITRIFMDTGGSDTLYYMIQSNLNATRIVRDKDAAAQLRFFGTLSLVSYDFGTLMGYIHPYVGQFSRGILISATSLISGTFNFIWRDIIHLVDSEYKMFLDGSPANGRALSDSFSPIPNVYPTTNCIPPSDCSLSIYANVTTVVPGNFMIFMQDNYREITGVHKMFLFGFYTCWRSFQNALSLASTVAGNWIFSLFYILNTLWDSLVQTAFNINILLFFESQIQRSLFISEWKFDEFVVQVDFFGQNTSAAIITLDANGCVNMSIYNSSDPNFVCSWALATESFFGIFNAILQQIVFVFTGFLVPPLKIPNFDDAINITEETVRNLTGMFIKGVIPPVLVNTDGTTLSQILLEPTRDLFSAFFLLLTVPNFVFVTIATLVTTTYSGNPQTAFTNFVTTVGVILQYTGDQIITRVGNFAIDLGVLLDRLFNAVPGIFGPLMVNIILIINVIRNAFIEFAIKLLAKLFAVIGTFIAIFFNGGSMDTRIAAFFTALADFLLFVIIQAPLFLLNFIIGLLDVILPPPLNVIVVTILKLLVIGLCNIIQFFIDAVSAIVNFFGGSMTPINLCCNGGCTKKKRGMPFGSSRNRNNRGQEEDEIEEDIQFTEGEARRKEYIDKIHIFLKSSMPQNTACEDPTVDYNVFSNSQASKSPSVSSFPKSKFLEKIQKAKLALNIVMNNRENDEQLYFSNPIHNEEDGETSSCLDVEHLGTYVNRDRVCPNVDKTTQGSTLNPSINDNYMTQSEDKKRNLHQNTTNTTQQPEVFLTQDEAIVFMAHMVSWNGSTGCDIFVNNFVKKNLTIDNFTILEDIYLRECITKRAIGEIVSIFPQFRWVPPDILYDPFSVIKVVFDAIKAYEVYAQYQRDRAVPRSIFLSEAYQKSWSDMGLNISFMTVDNYENVMLNYTLMDYFTMNNANPDFIDALTDGFKILSGNTKSTWSGIYNLSMNYRDSSIKYLDEAFSSYLEQLSQNSTDFDGQGYTQTQIDNMRLWKAFLDSLAATTVNVTMGVVNEVKKRNILENIGTISLDFVGFIRKGDYGIFNGVFYDNPKNAIVDQKFSLYFPNITETLQTFYMKTIRFKGFLKGFLYTQIFSHQSCSTSKSMNCDSRTHLRSTMLTLCEIMYLENHDPSISSKITETLNEISVISKELPEFKSHIDECVRRKISLDDSTFVSFYPAFLYTYGSTRKALFQDANMYELAGKFTHTMKRTFYESVLPNSFLLNVISHLYNYGNNHVVHFIDRVNTFIPWMAPTRNMHSNSISSKRNVMNITQDYPCIPQILGYCTDCLFVDSTFSLFYQIGTRLQNNYTMSSNNSLMERNVFNWNYRYSCLTYGPNFTDPLCGCRTSYFGDGPYAVNDLPGQDNPLAFPSTLKILPGNGGTGTLYDVLHGDALSSLSTYLGNLAGVSESSSNSEWISKLFAGIGRQIKTAAIAQTAQTSTFKRVPRMGSSNTDWIGGNGVSIYDVANYPTLYTTISQGGNIPIEILKRNPLSMCEIYILLFYGDDVLSPMTNAHICDMYGWPSLGSGSIKRSKQQTNDPEIISPISNPLANHIYLRANLTNGDTAITLASYIIELLNAYQFAQQGNGNNTASSYSPLLSVGISASFPATNRITSYYNSGSIDLTYLIFYIINLRLIGEVIDALASALSSFLSAIQSPANLFSSVSSSSNRFASRILDIPLTPDDSVTPEANIPSHYIFHPFKSTTIIDILADTMPSYDTVQLSAESIVDYEMVNTRSVGIQSSLMTIYETIIMANYDYDCAIYRRTSLFEGIVTVTLVYLLICIGIGISMMYIGLGAITTMFIEFLFMSTWWIAVLIYTYNYPLLNLFPFMLLPPCLADDAYELLICKLAPKCLQIFYPLSKGHNYTLTNCMSCPSTIKFSHCKYDYGFYDFIDSIFFILKWFAPTAFDQFISSGLDDSTMGIFSVLKNLFPFSYLFTSEYFQRKIDTFSPLNMSNIHTFDTYVWCFTTMTPAFVPSASTIFSVAATIFFVLVFIALVLLLVLWGLILAYIYWLHALFRNVMYNYIYGYTPQDEKATDKIILQELSKRAKGSSSKTNIANNTTSSSSYSKKRTNKRHILRQIISNGNRSFKPDICYQEGFVPYVYNNIWWRNTNTANSNMRVTSQITQRGDSNISYSKYVKIERFLKKISPGLLYPLWVSFWIPKHFNGLWKRKFDASPKNKEHATRLSPIFEDMDENNIIQGDGYHLKKRRRHKN